MQVMDALGATWGRSRLMRLSGRSQLAAHVDTNYYWQERMRVHVPIVTTPAVRFHCGESDINIGAGECWLFDTWRRPGVVNPGDVNLPTGRTSSWGKVCPSVQIWVWSISLSKTN